MGTVATFTLGGSSYSVYSTGADAIASANAYFAARLGASAWTGDTVETADKKRALVTATRAIDRALWSGSKLVGGQSTQWPRTGATCNGEAVADGTPDEIAFGTFELALALLEDESVQDKRSTRTDIRSVAAGTAQVEFFQPPPGEETRFPTIVQDLVGCFLAGAATVVGRPMVSGEDVDSSFGEDDFERQEGFS